MQIMDGDQGCQHGVFLYTRLQNRKRIQMYRSSLFIYAKYNVKKSDMFFQYRRQIKDLHSFLLPIPKKSEWDGVIPVFLPVLFRAGFITSQAR